MIPFQTKYKDNNMCFLYNLYTILMLYELENFISYKFILSFFVFSVARTDAILPVVREITLFKIV
jgi:hypothetical protein